MLDKVEPRVHRLPSTGVAEVATAFLVLGLTSFGGPVAHLGYFRREFVSRRRWLDDARFGQLLGLCQSLPGPASSQLGFVLGTLRAGWAGGIAAFAGFTLPSALLMVALAAASSTLGGAAGQQAVHGLKLVAVAVVAQALLGMSRTLTPDLPRAALALAAAAAAALSATAATQLLVIATGAALGPWLCPKVQVSPGAVLPAPWGRRTGAVLLGLFGILLLMALLVTGSAATRVHVAAAFYRAGALTFGGGHVVLPLLTQAVVDRGWLDKGAFLTGYGAAQAVPGPMFTVAAYLGERLQGGHGGPLTAALSLLAIFLPGLLLVGGMLPFWQFLAAKSAAVRMLAGINAGVVGLLAAALYNPIWISAVQDGLDLAVVLVAFGMLVAARWPAWTVVLWCVTACVLRSV